MARFIFLLLLTILTYPIQFVIFAAALLIVILLSDPFQPSADPNPFVLLHPRSGYDFHKGWILNLINWVKKEIS